MSAYFLALVKNVTRVQNVTNSLQFRRELFRMVIREQIAVYLCFLQLL